eukprot:COSAG02_NODE_263_length_26627_cov_47.198168_12_plen_130_part_00
MTLVCTLGPPSSFPEACHDPPQHPNPCAPSCASLRSTAWWRARAGSPCLTLTKLIRRILLRIPVLLTQLVIWREKSHWMAFTYPNRVQRARIYLPCPDCIWYCLFSVLLLQSGRGDKESCSYDQERRQW